jgi:ribosomal silencing factor RsfS
MILIADSGSTKTDWCLIDKNEVVLRVQTKE